MEALSGDDPDLFLESVRFEETRNYIRNIYEIYTVYRRCTVQHGSNNGLRHIHKKATDSHNHR
jgi:hypothetical protein